MAAHETYPETDPSSGQEIDLIESAMTPREVRLERAALGLRIGAIAYGLMALLIVLAAILASSQSTPDFFNLMHRIVLNGFQSAPDIAIVAGILLLLANASGLLVLMVGVLAQEFWTFFAALIFIGINLYLLLGLGFFPALIAFVAIGWSLAILVQDLRAFRANPVMLKELRERMRGARAFAVITVYLALMSAFAILLFLANSPLTRGLTTSVTGDLGRVLFAGIVGLEMLLIIFIAPAFTAGAVTGERERKTYDLLQITLLPRPSFIIGKLESALGYIFLLLLAAIPLQSIAFLFGGVTETELIISFEILAVTAITFGTIGLFFSTVTDRTLTASVRAYSLALGILIGVPVVASLIIRYFNDALLGQGTGFVGAPFVEAALIYLGAFLTSLNPFTTAIYSQQLVTTQQKIGFWTATLNSNGGTIPLVSPWISFTIIYLVVASVLIVISIRRIRSSEL